MLTINSSLPTFGKMIIVGNGSTNYTLWKAAAEKAGLNPDDGTSVGFFQHTETNKIVDALNKGNTKLFISNRQGTNTEKTLQAAKENGATTVLSTHSYDLKKPNNVDHVINKRDANGKGELAEQRTKLVKETLNLFA